MRVNKQNRIVLKLDPYRPDIRPASDVTVCNALHEAAMWHSRDGRDATARWYRRIGDAIVTKGLPLSEYTLSTHSLLKGTNSEDCRICWYEEITLESFPHSPCGPDALPRD